MKTSAYKPTLSPANLKRIEELKKTGSLNEKQQKKLDVLTLTHAGEKREVIATKLGINMDTITEWKKLFVKEGMEVYLGLKAATKKVQIVAKKTTQKVVKNVKTLQKKVDQKFDTKKTSVAPNLTIVKEEKNVELALKSAKKKIESNKKMPIDPASISKIEQYIVEVLKNSYTSVANAIETYSHSHGTATKKKILETYKSELKHAKKLIKEWTEKVKDLKKDMAKKDKNNKKDEKKKKDVKDVKKDDKKVKKDKKGEKKGK